jgi:4-amino-4-deoxy-L-arabinose transferase-like glycosyltransferase
MPVSVRAKLIFAIVIGLVCVARFVFFVETYRRNPDIVIDPDSLSYLNISQSMFERGAYERDPGFPELHRPPGYPSFLVAHYAVFGKHDLFAPVVSQHVLTYLMALMIAWLALQFGGGAAAIMAAGLYLTDFTSYYYVNEILSETLFAFALVVALVLVRAAMDNRQILYPWLLFSGLVLSFAIFVRPVGMFLVYPAAVLIGLYVYWTSRRISKGLAAATIFILPWIVLGGAWYLRSYLASGAFTFTSYETGVFDQRLADVFRSALGVDFQTGMRMAQATIAEGAKATEVFFSVIFKYPWDYVKVTAMDIGRLLFSPAQWHLKFYLPQVFGDQFPIEGLLLSGRFSEIAAAAARRPAAYLPIVFLVFLHLVVIYAGAALSLAGIWKRSFNDKCYFIFLLIMIGYFIAITFGFIGHARMRVPFLPVLAVVSGYGFSLIYTKMRPA